MNIKQFKKILSEEVESVLSEASITKRFQKAVEALQSIQLKQQELRKKFVAEKKYYLIAAVFHFELQLLLTYLHNIFF